MCIGLNVHEIAEIIQLLENEVPDCRPGEHSNTFQSVWLGTGNEIKGFMSKKVLLTLPEIALGIICAKIGSTPSSV
jgi:hypothetical protein